jgi:putative transposase
MRVAAVVVLSPEERAQLRRLRDRKDLPRSVRLRARIVLAAAGGARDVDIARGLRVTRRTAALWRHRFLDARVPGLEPKAPVGRRGGIPEERLQAIVRRTIARPAPGGRRPSTRHVARQFGVSHTTVARLRRVYHLRPAADDGISIAPDPGLPLAPWDVVGLYLRSPRGLLALTLRPRANRGPPERAANLAPNAPRVGLAFGPLATMPAPYRGTRGIESEYLALLNSLVQRLPSPAPLHVLLVTGEPGIGAALERWRIRHPYVEFEATRDFETWQARAHDLLRESGRRAIPRRQFHSPAELVRSIGASVASYRPRSGAYSWIASRRQIEAGDAAYRLRQDLAATAHPGFRRDSGAYPANPGDGGSEDLARGMARTILREYLHLKRADRLTVVTWSGTVGYSNALVIEALRLGGRPLVLYRDEPTYWAATTEVAARDLEPLGDHWKAALHRTDALVSFFGPSDRERFHSIPGPTMMRLGQYEDALYRAAVRSGARAVQMAIGRVSQASARMYAVDAERWRSELVAGTLVPPRVLRRRGSPIARAFRRGRLLEISHPNGTRLSLRLKGYRPTLADGTVRPATDGGDWSLVTVPAGVVTVAVDESFGEGTFRSNRASSVGLSDTVGELVDGRWTFRRGRLASYAYGSGEEFFAQSYARARSGRDRPGAVSVGLNEHLRLSPLLEDQGLGTVTLQIGGNDHLGGRSHAPWRAWMFLDGADLRVDGRTWVRQGVLRT